jgi:hypothetical protein
MLGYAIVDTLLTPQKSVQLISLNEKVIILPEINVTPVKAEDIINKVCTNIETNYPSTPTSFNAIYRKQVVENSDYAFLGSALFSVTSPRYWFDESVKAKDEILYEVKVGEVKASINKLEHIKITIPPGDVLNLMSPAFSFICAPEYSHYKITRQFYWNDSPYFEIWFKTREKYWKKAPIEGTMIVDATDYALVSATYNIQRENEKHTGYNKANKIYSVTIETNKYVRKVFFEKKAGHLWGLKYAQVCWEFETSSEKAQDMNKKYVLISDLLVSPDNPSVTVTSERVDLDKDFFNKKPVSPSDWKAFNVIVPDFSIKDE